MSVEEPSSLENPSPYKSVRAFLSGLGTRLSRLLPSRSPLDSEGKFTDRELQRRGTELVIEAREIYRGIKPYRVNQMAVYTETFGYSSTDRPMQIGAEFVTTSDDYSVRVTEAQDTTPLAFLMVIEDRLNPQTTERIVAYVDLRRFASRQPEIAITGATTNTPEAAVKIRQSLSELRTQL